MTADRWTQIEAVFQSAIERAPHERAAFVQQACGADESLRREVERLLAADASVEADTLAMPAQVAADLFAEQEVLPPEQMLHHYTIVSQLGAGGMGVVYLAEDTKLHRKVALKLLPPQFTHDADRVRRFEQEALAVSALNHPNILTIYEIGESGSHHFIITEFIEGQTLRQRLAAGPMPVRTALDIAGQIASALAAAHNARIIHRDIKPENVMVRPDGVVKVLDFGLAKLTEARGSNGADSTSPGLVMGTIGYMSPEQVQGQKADHRSDLFAFGVVLYEMVSGQRAFIGASHVEVMHAILKDEPPELSELNPKVSPALERIVRRCLEKQPEQRFQTASDLGFALSALTATSGPQIKTEALPLPAITQDLPVSGKMRWLSNARLAWMIAGLLLLGMAGLTWAYFARRPVSNAVTGRLTIPLPENMHELREFLISPDGRTLAFNAWREGKIQLWVRPLDSFTVRPVPGTVGNTLVPIWSPDSRWIVFKADDKLKKVDLTDGTQQTLCDIPRLATNLSGTWNRAGDILIFHSSLLYRVPATGGAPAPVPGFEQAQPGVTRHWPWFLPDGQYFLYLVSTSQPESSEVYVASLDGKMNNRLLAADSNATYTATAAGEGRLLFLRNGSLMAQPFDAQRLSLSGEPVRVADSVWFYNSSRGSYSNRGNFSVSDNGTLAYIPRSAIESTQLSWIDRTGKQLESISVAKDDELLRLSDAEFGKLSPDGKRVAIRLLDANGKGDIYVLDLARGARTRVTLDPGDDNSPVWSPDGTRLVWVSTRGGATALYQKLASGAGQEELLLKSDVPVTSYDWSSDGRFISYMRYDPQTNADIWVLPLEGDRHPIPFLQTPFREVKGRFSPDGRWIAYQSNETGVFETYVQPFPASGGKWQVSTQSGSTPLWRGDGNELFYHSDDGKQMAVEVKGGKTFAPGLPKVLFDLRAIRWVVGTNYSVAKDGQRFLFVTRPALPTADLHFVVVVNWAEGAKP